jgi:integrase
VVRVVRVSQHHFFFRVRTGKNRIGTNMARSTRFARLENRTNRLKLPVSKKPVYVKIDRGIALGYRRNQGPGTWVMRVMRDREDWTKAIGVADDYEDAAGGRTLSYWTAQARARELAVGQRDESAEIDASKPATVTAALNAYETDLAARGADAYNARRCCIHLSASLANKAVALLTAKELRHWRDGLLKRGLAAPTVKRTCRALKAALNLAASHDPRISNAAAWRTGLASLPDAENARNVILPEKHVRAIMDAAWDLDADLGLLVECAAVTGARVSQLARLEVDDLQDNRSSPKLMMPTSKKGRGQKQISRYPVPISASLAAKLRSNRSAGEPLLLRQGARWRPYNHRHPFAAVVIRAGLDPAIVTIYALRHSSIVRQLLANVPIRIVAAHHDTSVPMIEKTYSKYIGDHSDALTRRALLDPVTSQERP